MRPGTWVINQGKSMEPVALMQLMRGFSHRLGGVATAVAVREGAVVPQQYADLAVELARWPAGACGGRLLGRPGWAGQRGPWVSSSPFPMPLTVRP